MLTIQWHLGQWVEFRVGNEFVRMKCQPSRSGRRRKVKLVVDAPLHVEVVRCEVDEIYYSDGSSTLTRGG